MVVDELDPFDIPPENTLVSQSHLPGSSETNENSEEFEEERVASGLFREMLDSELEVKINMDKIEKN